MKRYISIVFVLAVIFGAAIVLGKPYITGNAVQLLPAKVLPSVREVMVPQQAIDNSPVIEENRVIAPTTSLWDKASFKLKGCKILHSLNDATAVSCPEGVEIEGAVKDRINSIHGIEADVQINADDVWNLSYDGTGVLVAVLDTGVDEDHIELASSLVGTQNFVRGPGFDADGHGTHVSGIVAGDGINEFSGRYAKGVAPGASLIVGKVCKNGCYDSDIMAGIEWAVAQGADIISMSIGGGNFGDHCDSDTLAAKVNWAASQGVVVTVSSGNDGAGVSSPACASGAIAVGAVDKIDNLASWSNTGPALDVVAPGVDIFSTYSCRAAGDCNSYWYATMSGTSMSAPHVAGLAALILQKNPGYSVADVKEAIYNTAHDLGAAGWDEKFGHGRIDALAALNYNQAPVDSDGDGYTSDVDCNDNNAQVNPGATEVCNGVDDDCDGSTDEGFDADNDGYATCTGDCNDNDSSINPGASEAGCDGIDNDCDAAIDEDYSAFTCGVGACMADSVCSAGIEACTEGSPSEDVCGDSIDNDCDGETDEGCTPTVFCGDGVCAGPLLGEDCHSCSSDCGCTGKSCSRSCCGDGICKNENPRQCPVDCA